jgi:hypothetical protein
MERVVGYSNAARMLMLVWMLRMLIPPDRVWVSRDFCEIAASFEG